MHAGWNGSVPPFYPSRIMPGMPVCTSCNKERADAEMSEGRERGGCFEGICNSCMNSMW